MLGLLALSACTSGVLTIPDDELTLEITSPSYADFAGGSEVRVTGNVFPNRSVVTIENREVVVGTDGSFDVLVPIAGAYRNLDIRAFYKEQLLEERIPVFSGEDPAESWPGGIGIRVTPRLFEPIADLVADAVDESTWEDDLLAQIPSIETEGFWLIPTELSHRPAQVDIRTSDEGLVLEVVLRDVFLDLDGGFVLAEESFDAPTRIGWQEFRFTAGISLSTDANGGLVLSTTGGDLVLSDPVIELGAFDLSILDFVLDFIADLLSGIGDFVLDDLLGLLGNVPLGPAIEQEIDLLGTPLIISLAELGTDDDGVFLDLGLGIGGPPGEVGAIPRPTIEDGRAGADLVVSMHEGLFAPLLESDLLELLEQDLELNGFLGQGVGLVFRNLPRGGEAPADVEGWCINVDPGEAKVVRMSDDLAKLASAHLPDLQLRVGVSHGETRCAPWLQVSMALTASFGLEDLALALDLEAPDGKVLFYDVQGEYEEQELIDGLAGLFDLLVGFAGGSLDFDLGELLGGGELIPGVELDPRVTSIQPMERDGEVVPGLYAIGLDLL